MFLSHFCFCFIVFILFVCMGGGGAVSLIIDRQDREQVSFVNLFAALNDSFVF